eukprot:11186878-Lingulodinium_polyedra.AAC.1
MVAARSFPRGRAPPRVFLGLAEAPSQAEVVGVLMRCRSLVPVYLRGSCSVSWLVRCISRLNAR